MKSAPPMQHGGCEGEQRCHGSCLERRRPGRALPLDERPEAGLALVARPSLGDPAGGLRPVRPVEHEALGVPRRARAGGAELAEDGGERALQVGRDLVDEADPERRSRRRSARP